MFSRRFDQKELFVTYEYLSEASKDLQICYLINGRRIVAFYSCLLI